MPQSCDGRRDSPPSLPETLLEDVSRPSLNALDTQRASMLKTLGSFIMATVLRLVNPSNSRELLLQRHPIQKKLQRV